MAQKHAAVLVKAFLRRKVRRLQSENALLREVGWAEGRAVIRGGMQWWRYKRPLSWNAEQHEKNPTVNCAWASEDNFARACAQLARKRKELRAKARGG